MTAPSADLAQVAARLAARGESFPPRAAIEIGVAVLEVLGGDPSAWAGGAAGVRLTVAGEVSVAGRSSGELPDRGDVYAAAALVVELLAAEPIGETSGEDDHERRLDDLMAGIAEQLGTSHPARATLALLRVALAPAPCDRPEPYALAEAFADLARALPGERLDAFAARVVLFAATTPRVPVPSGIPASRTLRPALAPVPPPRDRSRAVVAGIVGLLALGGAGFGALALAVGAVVLVRGRAAEPEPIDLAVSVTPAPTPVRVPDRVPPPEPPLGAAPELGPGYAPELGPAYAPAPGPAPGLTRASEQGSGHAPELARASELAAGPAPGLTRPSEHGPAHASELAPASGAKVPSSEPVTHPTTAAHPTVVEAGPGTAEGPPGPRVEKALVSMADAERLVVTCGDKAEVGTRSVRIEDFPGGPCTVRAWVLGQPYQAEPALDRVGQWTCALADGALVCDG